MPEYFPFGISIFLFQKKAKILFYPFKEINLIIYAIIIKNTYSLDF